MRIPTAWVGLAAGVYVAATLALFPAATALRWLGPPELTATGVEGTIWRGRAALASAAGLGVYDLEWSMSPWALLTGRVRVRVQAREPNGFFDAQILAGVGSIEIRDLQAATSLETIAQLVPIGDVQGMVGAQILELELDNGWPMRGVGQVRLAELRAPLLLPSGPSDLIPLGSYLIELVEAETPALAGRFADQGGPVAVEGRFTLGRDRSYELSGLIEPRADAPREIVQAMAFLVPENGDSGRRVFELSGRL